MSDIRDLDWLAFAERAVKMAADDGGNAKDHPFSRLVEMPARIQRAGLVSALLWLERREESENSSNTRLYNVFCTWLRDMMGIQNEDPESNGDLESLVHRQDLARITRDTMEFAALLKRCYKAQGTWRLPQQAGEPLSRERLQINSGQDHPFGQGCQHPGLRLNKLAWVNDQKAQKQRLSEIAGLEIDGQLFAQAKKRYDDMLKALQADSWPCYTTGPLTLHLSGSPTLENAGICMHPIHGFVYLPGSGLKGMARAYAETVWLPAQQDQIEKWKLIEEVFGWSPGSRKIPTDNGKTLKPWMPKNVPDRGRDEQASAGAVVFHDAWPETLPKLTVDIVNNHHKKYYQNDTPEPPGDWESPEPSYFLAVPPSQGFTFAISKRHPRVDMKAHEVKLMELARQWLVGALYHLGAGAKTNAGYGAFAPPESETAPSVPQAALPSFEATLELVTPAFLAGANQEEEDCDLRPATLRGLLRWWWRTMHAGHMDAANLRELETIIWGSTSHGGAVRLTVHKTRPAIATVYTHPAQQNSGRRYLAYGMDENVQGVRRQRVSLKPGAQWEVRFTAKPRTYRGISIDSGDILAQAQAALWLLCNYGGVGAKSRKGFGSLQLQSGLSGWDCAKCKNIASKLRKHCFGGQDNSFDRARAESPSISDPYMQQCVIMISTNSANTVLEHMGKAYIAVASRFKHNCDAEEGIAYPNKAAWGLPRKIHGPNNTPIPGRQNPSTHQRPIWLDFPRRPNDVPANKARHSSPIHLHVASDSAGTYVVRVLAMPANYLPDRATNIEMLTAFVSGFKAELESNEEKPNNRQRTKIVSQTTAQVKMGTIIHKENPKSKKARVRCDDGTVVTASAAKQYTQQQRVKIFAPDAHNWQIQGPAK